MCIYCIMLILMTFFSFSIKNLNNCLRWESVFKTQFFSIAIRTFLCVVNGHYLWVLHSFAGSLHKPLLVSRALGALFHNWNLCSGHWGGSILDPDVSFSQIGPVYFLVEMKVRTCHKHWAVSVLNQAVMSPLKVIFCVKLMLTHRFASHMNDCPSSRSCRSRKQWFGCPSSRKQLLLKEVFDWQSR